MYRIQKQLNKSFTNSDLCKKYIIFTYIIINPNYIYLRVRGSRLVFITLRILCSLLLWLPLLPFDAAGIKLPLLPLPLPPPLLPRNFNLGSRDASTLAGAFPWESCLPYGWNLCEAELDPIGGWGLFAGVIVGGCSVLWFWLRGATGDVDVDVAVMVEVLGEFLPWSPFWRL